MLSYRLFSILRVIAEEVTLFNVFEDERLGGVVVSIAVAPDRPETQVRNLAESRFLRIT